MTAPIPDTLSYASGSVLPLAVCTSAMGLYPSRRLGLPLPQTTPTPKSALVWGGSSSCGSAAIQLAVASGVTVVATASAKNHTSVRSLGAAAVLDDKSATIAQDLVDVIKKSPGQVAGALGAIGQEATWTVCADVLKALGGGRVVSNSAAESMDAPDGVEVVGGK